MVLLFLEVDYINWTIELYLKQIRIRKSEYLFLAVLECFEFILVSLVKLLLHDLKEIDEVDRSDAAVGEVDWFPHFLPLVGA